MSTLQRLLVCAAMLVGAVQPIMAHQVNACIDSHGRKVMTDRPCENPATEREREKVRKVQGVGVQQVNAPDIFETRTKLSNDGKPMSADSPGDAGGQPQQGR